MHWGTKLGFCAIAAIILFVGHLNWLDIKACEDEGHSTEYCLRMFNP